MSLMNYRDIVDNLETEKIKKLLYSLGVTDVIEKEDCLITNTICHNEDHEHASKKLYWYKNSKLFCCYTECGVMTVFQFLEHYYEAHGIDYDWYSDIYLVAKRCSKETVSFGQREREKRLDVKKYRANKGIALETYSSSILNMFENKKPIEWLEEGITPSTMDKYGIKFWGVENKIIIPHVDVSGALVGIRARALNQEDVELVGKYMPVKIEGKFYSHPLSLNLYGLYQNKENIKKKGICYLFESEKSVLKLENEKENCALAVCGSNLNKYQIFLLLKTCQPKEIVVCFDNEEKKGSQKYFDKLYKTCKKYTQYCTMSFVYDWNGLTKQKDAPIDEGIEIFEKLLKERIIVR